MEWVRLKKRKPALSGPSMLKVKACYLLNSCNKTQLQKVCFIWVILCLCSLVKYMKHLYRSACSVVPPSLFGERQRQSVVFGLNVLWSLCDFLRGNDQVLHSCGLMCGIESWKPSVVKPQEAKLFLSQFFSNSILVRRWLLLTPSLNTLMNTKTFMLR